MPPGLATRQRDGRRRASSGMQPMWSTRS